MAVRPFTGQGPIGVRSTPAHRRRQPTTAESFGGPPNTQRDLSPEDQRFLDQYNFQQAELDAHEAAGLAPSREGQVGGGPLQGISDIYTPMREYQLPGALAETEFQMIKDWALPVDSAELGMAGLFGGRVPLPGVPKAVAKPVTAAVRGVKPWLDVLRRIVTGGGEAAAKGDDLADIAKLAMKERPVIPMDPKATTEDLDTLWLKGRDRPILDPKVKEDYVPSPEATFHGMTGERLTPYTPSPEAKFHGMTGEPLTAAKAAEATDVVARIEDVYKNAEGKDVFEHYRDLADASGYTDEIAIGRPERYGVRADSRLGEGIMERPYFIPHHSNREDFLRWLQYKTEDLPDGDIHDLMRDIDEYAQAKLFGGD